MYSLNVKLNGSPLVPIERCMSANESLELLPVIEQICHTEYKFNNAVPIYIGNGKYLVFDLTDMSRYALVEVKSGGVI